jgi:transcriptional regulator with XRE-family HTH domain
MPAAIEEITKRKVIEQWIAGFTRAKISTDNDIGEGTVTSIISDFKRGLESSDFESARELAVEAKKQGLTLSDLASRFRLYNYFRKSGASEDEIESFIDNIHSTDVPSERVIEYLNQLYEISKEQSIPIQEVPNYMNQKLHEKQKIDQEIKEANDILQNKNVTVEAINQHIKLNEELNKHGLSTHDIPRLFHQSSQLASSCKDIFYCIG